MTLVLCEPGTNDRHELVGVQSSSANQKPTAESGFEYKNVESSWEFTTPPICGCLQMTWGGATVSCKPDNTLQRSVPWTG